MFREECPRGMKTRVVQDRFATMERDFFFASLSRPFGLSATSTPEPCAYSAVPFSRQSTAFVELPLSEMLRIDIDSAWDEALFINTVLICDVRSVVKYK